MTASMMLGLVTAAEPAPLSPPVTGSGAGPAIDPMAATFGATFGAIVASLMPPPVVSAAPLELVLAPDWQQEADGAVDPDADVDTAAEPAPVRLDGEARAEEEDATLVPLEKGLSNWMTRIAGQSLRGKAAPAADSDQADPDLPPVVAGRRDSRPVADADDAATSPRPPERLAGIPVELSSATSSLLTLAASTLWQDAAPALPPEPVPDAPLRQDDRTASPLLESVSRFETLRLEPAADQRVALARYQGGDEGLDPETLLALRATSDPGIEIGGFSFPIDEDGNARSAAAGPEVVRPPRKVLAGVTPVEPPIDNEVVIAVSHGTPGTDATEAFGDRRSRAGAPGRPAVPAAVETAPVLEPPIRTVSHREAVAAPGRVDLSTTDVRTGRDPAAGGDGSPADGNGARQFERTPVVDAAGSSAAARPEFRLAEDAAAPVERARPAAGPDPAVRIARRVDNLMVDLRDEAGDLGRLKVTVRGPNVRATIIPNDAGLADRLNLGIRDLRQSLEDRGFADPRITVQTPARRDLQGWLPVGREPLIDLAATDPRASARPQQEHEQKQDRSRPDDPRQEQRQDGGRSPHRSRDHRQGRQGGQS